MIARVVDGLPLVGTMTEDEQVSESFDSIGICNNDFKTIWNTVREKCVGVSKSGKNVVSQIEYTLTTKMFNRNWSIFIPVSFFLTSRCSPWRCTNIFVLCWNHQISYLIENDVCYLVMCDKMFSKRSAFSYLEDLALEFHKNYGRKVNTVTRPYAFIEFDVYIQKTKKNLSDRRRNITSINTQLQDVQRIMVCMNW